MSDEHESSEGDCDLLLHQPHPPANARQMSMNPRKGTVTPIRCLGITSSKAVR